MKIILKVETIKTTTNYGKAGLEVSPVGDLFYAVSIEETEFEIDESNQVTLNVNGMRTIIKGLLISLAIDQDDF